MNTFNERDIQAFAKIRLKYTEEYDELTESMFQYMNSYINGNKIEAIMFLDEIENITGINKHDDVVDFILIGR